MVAVIHSSKSLRNVLNYNEQKVKGGLAVCLEAGFYPKEATELSFKQKLLRLEKLTSLNQQTKVNAVHISLNFDPSEELSDNTLREIAAVYLARIGFGLQPYLLYRHIDAGHPHIHLLTTNIRQDGSRIPLHNLGRNESEKARKGIEILFGLIKAEESQLREANRLKPVDARKVDYGRVESKRAMGNVISVVLQKYRYASLAELNAVLGLYNVMADLGNEGSRIFQNRGLVYRVLDQAGHKVGVPVKASDFYFKPGLKFLDEKFEENKLDRDGYKARLKNAIDLQLIRAGLSLAGLVKALGTEGIDTVVRQNAQGQIYGLTFVDHRTRCVINGSALGKAYGAKSILERCTEGVADGGKIKQAASQKLVSDGLSDRGKMNADWQALTDALLVPAEGSGQMDWELKRKRKKKKKQRLLTD
jgi:hypothetical protein